MYPLIIFLLGVIFFGESRSLTSTLVTLFVVEVSEIIWSDEGDEGEENEQSLTEVFLLFNFTKLIYGRFPFDSFK